MEINKEKVRCIKNFYASLPLKVAVDNNLAISPTETYLLFEEGKEYEVSHEYKTSEEEESYFRYVASDLKYNVNGKKNVYERFATRENVNSPDKMWNFFEYFELLSGAKKIEDMNLAELKVAHERLYEVYQKEPIFAKAMKFIPDLKKIENRIEELEEDITPPTQNNISHLN